MKKDPKRPRGVPADAVFNAGDEQWELGARDAKGRRVGAWRYWWKTTGHLCCVSMFDDGGKKETYTRYHPDGTFSRKGVEIDGKPAPNEIIHYQKSKKPTTELALTDPDYKHVFRVEETYVRKGLSKWKNFDAKGRRIELDGTLIPMLDAKAYAKNFAPFELPELLAELVEFQNDVGAEMFAEGFALERDDKGLLRGFCDREGRPLASRSKQKEFLAAFLPIGSANGTGSVYCIWNDGTRKKPDDMPIVIFGDEGGYHVVAGDLRELLSIVGSDVEPMVGSDDVSFFKTPDHEASDEIDAFKSWLKARGIAPAKKPDAIAKKASALHQKRLESWLAKVR